MNREIKFRAWHIKSNLMISWQDMNQSAYNKGDYHVMYDILCARIPEYNVMQYTGLKDKNGKEIYEGDILRHPAKDEWEKINYISFEVFFHDNDAADNHVGFQFNRLHFNGSTCGYSVNEKFLPRYTQQMEVIGNIHQNPELLSI